MRFGLLLPHFGAFADRDRIIKGSIRAEELGFDSVWVRDHLVFKPHVQFEDPDNSFLEPFTVLTAIGAVTQRITLGTAALIPYRHPLTTAAILASLTQMVGPRVTIAFGAGTYDHEFEAVGLGGIFRPELVESNAKIFARVWNEDDVAYRDDHFDFEGISLNPKPAGKIPFWYGGGTPASARRAARYCDGWMPGRITMRTIEKRIASMRQMTAENGRPMPTIGVVPPTTIAETEEEAWAGTSVDGLLLWANERGKQWFWVKPESGNFETVEDLEGSLLAGTPDQVVEQVRRFEEVGVEHLVFDTRLNFERWHDSIELLGKHVIPALR